MSKYLSIFSVSSTTGKRKLKVNGQENYTRFEAFRQ
jgi:hypothetical protein